MFSIFIAMTCECVDEELEGLSNKEMLKYQVFFHKKTFLCFCHPFHQQYVDIYLWL